MSPLKQGKRLLSIFKYMRTTIGARARANRLFLSHVVIPIISS